MKITLILILMCLPVAPAYSKTQYVTDVLYITLRDGPSESFKVQRVLKTGTKLEIIGEKQDGYSHVRTVKGEEGWAKAKYLLNDPVAMLKIDSMIETISSIENENENLKQKNINSRQKMKELEKDRKRLESKNKTLTNENISMKKISANPMKLSEENAALKVSNEEHESQILMLMEENSSFKSNSSRDWFLLGAGVLLFGILIGIILPNIRGRRGKDWA